MFTLIATVSLAIVGFLAKRHADRERESYDHMPSAVEDEYLRAILLHIRQDLQLGIFVMGLIVVFLGILADLLARH